MEGLERLVSESFARHGVEAAFDYRRLQWSPWFRCTDVSSLVQVSSKPGLFALAHEVVPLQAGGKRVLALLRISEADDLGMALGRLSLPRSPERELLASGRCFARFAVVEDPAQRHSAHAALQNWLTLPDQLGTKNCEPTTGLETLAS